MSMEKSAKENLRGFVERIETLRERKAALGYDEKAVFAEAKIAGLDTKTIRAVIRIRASDAADRLNAQALLDVYLHALGIEQEAPLFSTVGLMGVDPNVREQVIAALALLVPDNGDIVVTVAGARTRLQRNAQGEAYAEEIEDKRPIWPAVDFRDARERSFETEVTGEKRSAREMGSAAGKAKITKPNPFKKGDPQRAEWDKGYREALEGAPATV